ncbi:zinc finger protein 839 isoform X2 [Ambystoma mexicanum]|uniref:zinc finger protein 839 isoform X2 n=1 Tax=Ambystoma mexicanum TaxID=8296 RepID=UPI0037E997E1
MAAAAEEESGAAPPHEEPGPPGAPQDSSGSLDGLIFYVQPDGTLVEGSGLSGGQLRLLEEQLGGLQPEQATGPELPVQDAGEAGALPPLQPGGFMQNASQQLQSVAQHVALQRSLSAVNRLLQQEVGSIQVQSTQVKESYEKPMPPLAAITPQTVKLTTPLIKTFTTAGLNRGTQIIRIQPVSGSGEQQFILQNSPSDLPIQLLVQRPLPPPAALSTEVTTSILNGKSCTYTMSPVSAKVASSAPNHSCSTLEKKPKIKKSLKVKTRSGRISRPPKHKAKDYKFIKTEDLADGHRSDSDDYSELSVEEEDGGVVEKDSLFNSSSYNLKPKMFKCVTCEKCYIGKGGLARHYKLNPTHGCNDYSPQVSGPLTNGTGSTVLMDSLGESPEMCNSVLLEQPSIMDLIDESVPPPHVEEIEIDSNSDLQSGHSVEGERLSDPLEQDDIKILWSPMMKKGPGRPKGCLKSERPRIAGRPQCSKKRGKHGRATKSLGSLTAKQRMVRRKNRLKEMLQQCESTDFMDLVLPRLTELVTVSEFLLLKVEKGHPAKPFFPDVYREFEKLHEMVQSLARDHLSEVSRLTIQQTLEVKNPKVAESLGITENNFGYENPLLNTPQHSLLKRFDKQLVMEIIQERAHECADQELLPPMKKIKTEINLEKKSNVTVGQKGLQQNALNWCVQSTQQGQPNGNYILVEGCTNTCGPQRTDLHNLAAKDDLLNPAEAFCPLNEALECPQSDSSNAICEDVQAEPPEMSPSAEVLCQSDEALTSVERTFALPVGLPSGDVEGKGPQYGLIDMLKMHEHSAQLPDSSDHPCKIASSLSANVPADHLYLCKTQPVSPLHSPQQTLFSHDLKNVNELQRSIESLSNDQNELASVITEDETGSFEIAGESHELCTVGHEQLVIQTSDGLVLSHSDSAVLSHTEGYFVVTKADGTTMHIHTPGGVPTVEALLALEAKGQSEGFLML